MNKQVDWDAIRADYESGVSLRQLAATYGVSKSAIGDRKYREKWVQRAQNRTDTKNAGSNIHDLNAAARVSLAIKIFLEEHPTWEEIASRTGYASGGSAYNAVKRELNRRVTHDVQELRTQELYRIEMLMAKLYKDAMDKDNDGYTWAIDRFEKLSKRKSELMCLDKRPEEEAINQNYVKKIVLTHANEVKDASRND